MTEGVRRVAVFNWPKLAGGAAMAVAGLAVGTPGALVVAVGTTYFLVASLAASWWVYDHSDLHEWEWIRPLLASPPDVWALVHAGFDESGPGLPLVLGSPAAVVDVSPALVSRSASLRRARRRNPAGATSQAGQRFVPLADRSCDAVLLVFAAHEVRDCRQREELFADLRRVVRPNGRVLLVEHLRDGANIAVFGPGAWHFQPRREWLRLAASSGFRVAAEAAEARLVRGMALCPC